VTPDFFTTLHIPILKGRDVADGDTADSLWVAVVSESFVKRYWPDQDPIGRTFRHTGRSRTVVGMVGDIRVRGLERTSEPQMYLPARQFPVETVDFFYSPKELLIRHAGDGAALVAAIREIVHAVDPEQPIAGIRTLADIVAKETAPRRAQLQVLVTLAVIALSLAAVGIHGLLAYTVSVRSQEIGVRLALGAEPASVARMILLDGMRLAAAGIVLGVPCGYAAARGMSALLFGLEPGDPVTIAAALGLALLMTLAGSLLPALRAVRVSPMLAMRAE